MPAALEISEGQKLHFALFTKEYLPEAVPLFLAAFNGPPWHDAWTEETANRRLNQLLDHPEALGLVAFTSRELAAWILGEREQYYDGVVFQIKEFCVSPAWQSQAGGTPEKREYKRDYSFDLSQ